MASLHFHQTDSTLLLALKGFTVGTTLFVAGSMATASAQFLPGLILATQTKDSRVRPKYSRLESESGRLTPQPSAGQEKQLHLTTAAALQGRLETEKLGGTGYRLAAQQFSLMSQTAFVLQVPPELLSIAASGYLAYHYRGLGSGAWGKWAAVSALIVTIFPLTGGFMVPLDHKIARLAGTEPAIEPYEDAPPDHEAERSNTEEFLRKWNTLNAVRSGIMLAAGGVGLWGLLV